MTKDTAILTSKHQAALEKAVENGRFANRQDALEFAISNLDSDDPLLWAKPFVETGIAELDRGEGIPGDEVIEELHTRIDARRG